MGHRNFPGSPVVRTLLSLPRAQVHSLVGKLRFHKPCGMAKKLKKKKKKKKNWNIKQISLEI